MPSAPDVAVVGGGIVGAAAAAFLAEQGARVTLYERDRVAAAASGRNSGVVQHPFDPALAELHLEAVEHYRSLEGFDLPSEPAGLLLVGHDRVAVRRLTDELAVSHPGFRPTFLDAGELAAAEPGLGGDVAACALAIGYPVPPARATTAFAERAIRAGATIRVGDAARPRRTEGRVDGVVVGGGFEAAGAVLVAAGPWSPALVDPAGRWRPIRALWGVVVELALETPPRRVLEQAGIEIEPGGALDGVDFSLVTASGVTSLGSTFLATEPDPAAWVQPLIDHGARFVPEIAGVLPGRVRVCARPLSVDGRPLVGAVPGVEGLWIAAGHGPWGISTGPASARQVADAILGDAAAITPATAASRFEPPAAPA